MAEILHLNVKAKWFDLIASGVKKNEYREFKSYWKSRLLNKDGTFRQFDEVHFKNGYKSNSPALIVGFDYTSLIRSLLHKPTHLDLYFLVLYDYIKISLMFLCLFLNVTSQLTT